MGSIVLSGAAAVVTLGRLQELKMAAVVVICCKPVSS